MARTDLIRAGDKFALVATSTGVEDLGPQPVQMEDDLWVSNHPVVTFSDHWKGWLGSIRSDHLVDANLVVTTRAKSKAPSILDGENVELGNRVRGYFTGLMLSARFSCSEAPLWLTGANVEGEADVRQSTDFSALPHVLGLLPEDITLAQLGEAAAHAKAMTHMAATKKFLRFFHIVHVYCEARANRETLDQIHQFSRCLEGLIFPKPGDSTKKFKSRTELFIGPKHHDLMGELYEIRSAAEHMNDHLFVVPSGREERIEFVRKSVIVEFIARTSIARVLSRPALCAHFATDDALKAFWDLPEAQRRDLWGPPVDPNAGLVGFESDGIRDFEIGLA